jgi:predicted nucleotidyltransferase component of viral defense system
VTEIPKRDPAASIRARLLNLAKAEGSDFTQVLVRYTMERLLYRLSQSSHADQFLLKGALLFNLWYDLPHRATRDIDLLAFGASDLDTIAATFGEIAAVPCDDGMKFDPESIRVAQTRKETGYGGARVLLTANLAGAQCQAQIDVGFGDAVTPAATVAVYPVLLPDLPAPRLRVYPVYTVIAEKLHAITVLGMANTRLKDYLDLRLLLAQDLDLDMLAQAVAMTFNRRSTKIPDGLPMGLTENFGDDRSRQALWSAFLRKYAIPTSGLADCVRELREHLTPVLHEVRRLGK